MLCYCFTGAEGAGDCRNAALCNREECINDTLPCNQRRIGRFLFLIGSFPTYRPFLHHGYVHVVALFIHKPEAGAVVENPDLTLGYLTGSTEEITHPAVEGVDEQWHWETVTEYPNGGKDVQKVVDRPGVQAQEEWVEQVPIQKYIRYTAEELAAQEQAKKDAEARAKLPETVAALQKENEMLKQCLLEMSEIVYA